MEHTPPPFFKTGPTPLARLLLFSLLSLALLIGDARFASVAIYPFQRIAAVPLIIARRAGEFFVTHAALRGENARLTRQNMESAVKLEMLESLRAENAHLRALLNARSRVDAKYTFAEVLYTARDPFTRKIIVDKGFQNDIVNGEPVIDASGVIGQVTRVYPWLSEVTLITDKGHSVPVQNVRNGLRAILVGTGNDGTVELRFVGLNADFQNGDRLVTSGIDGVYPAGLPVAQITNVERNAGYPFSHISCKPAAGINRYGQVLIVHRETRFPQRPEEESKPVRGKKSRRSR